MISSQYHHAFNFIELASLIHTYPIIILINKVRIIFFNFWLIHFFYFSLCWLKPIYSTFFLPLNKSFF